MTAPPVLSGRCPACREEMVVEHLSGHPLPYWVACLRGDCGYRAPACADDIVLYEATVAAFGGVGTCRECGGDLVDHQPVERGGYRSAQDGLCGRCSVLLDGDDR